MNPDESVSEIFLPLVRNDQYPLITIQPTAQAVMTILFVWDSVQAGMKSMDPYIHFDISALGPVIKVLRGADFGMPEPPALSVPAPLAHLLAMLLNAGIHCPVTAPWFAPARGSLSRLVAYWYAEIIRSVIDHTLEGGKDYVAMGKN